MTSLLDIKLRNVSPMPRSAMYVTLSIAFNMYLNVCNTKKGPVEPHLVHLKFYYIPYLYLLLLVLRNSV